MWVSQSNLWNSAHTDLSKYFIEKLKQRVDHEETISNRHRTSNGFTLIGEIIDVASLAQKRIKSINRLVSLLSEATSKLLPSNICNDYILKKYHSDIIEYYMKLQPNRLKDSGREISDVLIQSKINFTRLKQQYYLDIKCEIEQIDFKSTFFERNALLIDQLIDCFIPYLLHQGYSNTSISDIAYRAIKKPEGFNSIIQLVNNFNGTKRNFRFLIKTSIDNEGFEEIKSYLDEKEVEFSKVSVHDVSNRLLEIPELKSDEELYTIKHITIDPHNYLRNLYDIALKNCVAKKNRLTLHYFMDFFDSVYWRFEVGAQKFQKSNMQIDPVNVAKRKSTLTETLVSSQLLKENDPVPLIKVIRDSIYYYNLALGSKSLENSLSLLWTSLETLLPYRLKDNDIENVQYFVSRSLSIGAIGREVTSFASRFSTSHWLNSNAFSTLSTPFSVYDIKKSEIIKKWIEWLSIDHSSSSNDPYDQLKLVSNLLCNQFTTLNNIFIGKHKVHKTAQYWIDKIKTSEMSIAFQLDRIYLHRNQIVHSGKFINEYSNLWNHLEWYVGKLLAYCVIEYLKKEDKQFFNKEELFMSLEADRNSLINLLEINKDVEIKDIAFTYDLVTKHSWQFF